MKPSLKFSIILSALSLFSFCATAAASDISYSNYTGDLNHGYSIMGYYIANSFTIGSSDAEIDSISVFVYGIGTNKFSLKIYLYTSEISSTCVYTADSTVTVTDSTELITFTFSGTTTLTAGKTYLIALYDTTYSASNSASWLLSSTTSVSTDCTAGSLYMSQYSGSYWYALEGASGIGQMIINPASVPEPASCAAMLGLGALGMLGIRRIRRAK